MMLINTLSEIKSVLYNYCAKAPSHLQDIFYVSSFLMTPDLSELFSSLPLAS